MLSGKTKAHIGYGFNIAGKLPLLKNQIPPYVDHLKTIFEKATPEDRERIVSLTLRWLKIWEKSIEL